jgi:hypothetical protein
MEVLKCNLSSKHKNRIENLALEAERGINLLPPPKEMSRSYRAAPTQSRRKE